MSKKVLLIPNMPYWSIDKWAKDIVKYNKSDLILDIVYFEEFLKDWEKYYNNYDLLFPMTNAIYYEFLYRDIPVEKVITTVTSYTSWDNEKTLPPGYNIKPPRSHINKLKKALLVNTICNKLWYVFSKHIPIIYTKLSCDLDMYYPDKGSRESDKLIIGWTGSLTNNGNIRGMFDLIEPACNEIEGVELLVQCVENEWIKDGNRMRDFYNCLDLYICASKSEGASLPILEAAACGVPSLTVDVGIVPELIDNNVNGFIIDRNLESFIDKINYIEKNRHILPEMGKKAREKMESDFHWNDIINQTTDLFQYSLELLSLKRGGYI